MLLYRPVEREPNPAASGVRAQTRHQRPMEGRPNPIGPPVRFGRSPPTRPQCRAWPAPPSPAIRGQPAEPGEAACLRAGVALSRAESLRGLHAFGQCTGASRRRGQAPRIDLSAATESRAADSSTRPRLSRDVPSATAANGEPGSTADARSADFNASAHRSARPWTADSRLSTHESSGASVRRGRGSLERAPKLRIRAHIAPVDANHVARISGSPPSKSGRSSNDLNIVQQVPSREPVRGW